jgi:hypothetical protein
VNVVALDPNKPCLWCARPESLPPGTIVPPSVRVTRCAGCGARVLIAASSRELVAVGGAQPACADCVPAGLTPAMTGGRADAEKGA